MEHRFKRCSCGNKLKVNEVYCILCKEDMTKYIVKEKNKLLNILLDRLYERVKYEK